MPKLGESLTEGTVLKWWKKVGEPVKKDETLLEVSTDKVDSEIPSPEDGVLVEIVAQEQETVAVEAVLARMETTEDPAARLSTKQKPSEKSKPDVSPVPEKKKSDKAPVTGTALVDVVMPKMGESLTEGTILKWWKNPGDAVKKDETLLEISTDKVDSEIPSPVEGILQETLHQENETVAVGQVIARIDSGKTMAVGKVADTVEPIVAGKPVKKPPVTPKMAETSQLPSRPSPGEPRRFYSPLVRTIARQEGIDPAELNKISGTGNRRRVTKKDVLDYIKMRQINAPASQVIQKREEKATIVPMDNVRKKIAEHMRQSLDTSAHVYSVSECDMTPVMTMMYSNRQRFQNQEGFKLTVTPFILYAAVKSLLDFPRVNASLDQEQIIEHRHINLGIAVATPKGLIVPVIKHAEEKSFTGLARSVNDMVERARTNKLTYDDIQGSTFSVTNYGIFGNIIGLPIINQPNVAILGMGAIKKRPVVLERPDGDSIAIRSMAFISMSYDHRLVDGELGGRFMQRLVEYLETMKEEIF